MFKKLIKKLFDRKPYKIIVQWNGKMYIHYAKTFKDALSWARCYAGHDVYVAVYAGKHWIAGHSFN